MYMCVYTIYMHVYSHNASVFFCFDENITVKYFHGPCILYSSPSALCHIARCVVMNTMITLIYSCNAPWRNLAQYIALPSKRSRFPDVRCFIVVALPTLHPGIGHHALICTKQTLSEPWTRLQHNTQLKMAARMLRKMERVVLRLSDNAPSRLINHALFETC